MKYYNKCLIFYTYQNELYGLMSLLSSDVQYNKIADIIINQNNNIYFFNMYLKIESFNKKIYI